MAAPSSVEDYLAALPEEPRAALEKLRERIKAAAPEATELISYQMPAFKNHCSLFPMSMKVIEDHREELEPYYAVKGTIRFRADKPLPGALVTKLVEARIEENAARSRR